MSQKRVCDRCGRSLKSGRVDIYAGFPESSEPTESICFKCDLAEKMEHWREAGVLHINLLVQAILAQDCVERGTAAPAGAPITFSRTERTRLVAENMEIAATIKHFESEAWFGAGIQTYVQQAKAQGHSVEADGLKALMYALAGRVMITLQDGTDTSVTVVTIEDETERVMGLRSVAATRDQACALLKKACELASRGQLVFEPDTEVSML